MAHATRDGFDVKAHKLLHVDPTMLKRGVGYRIAVAKATLAEVKASRLKAHSLQLGPVMNRPQAKGTARGSESARTSRPCQSARHSATTDRPRRRGSSLRARSEHRPLVPDFQ